MMQKQRVAPRTATQRLKQDYMRLKKDPIPYVIAEPLSSNILEWHYVVRGPKDTPYSDGLYHGKLIFPREFPFKPPSIYMLTPSGRFKCNTRLCLSISDFHPDTWNPAWSVGTILTGLLSFMLEKSPTLGSVESSDFTKRRFAIQSGQFNLRNVTFCSLFPELVEEIKSTVPTEVPEVVEPTQTDQQSNVLNIMVLAGVAIFAVLLSNFVNNI